MKTAVIALNVICLVLALGDLHATLGWINSLYLAICYMPEN